MPVKFIIKAFQSGISVNPTTNINQELRNAIILQVTDFDVERLCEVIEAFHLKQGDKIQPYEK